MGYYFWRRNIAEGKPMDLGLTFRKSNAANHLVETTCFYEGVHSNTPSILLSKHAPFPSDQHVYVEPCNALR